MSWFKGPLLAIETSCDETSAAILEGRTIRSNIVSSQVELHKRWGGVVPEAAARAHLEAILPVIEEALDAAGVPLRSVEAIAVTNRPGLVGALSVGVTAAKAFSLAMSRPFIGVHHLEGHLLSPLADHDVPFPHLSLVASGGHTEVVVVEGFGRYTLVAQTVDDAAGEAFDKCARLLGLGYPGGAAIQQASDGGNPRRYALPRSMPDDPSRFSFSGLKTAVLRLTEIEGDRIDTGDAAASVQEAIVDSLVAKTIQNADRLNLQAVTMVGGVAANSRLRERMARECERAGFKFFVPSPLLCTDNAGMIGLAGSWRLAQGMRSDFELDCEPNAALP